MKTIHNKVLLFGPDSSHALGVVRELGAANIQFELLLKGKSRNLATKSKYCQEYHEFSTYDEAVDYAIDKYGRLQDKAVLLAMGDLAAEIFDKRYNELNKMFYLSGTCEQGLLTSIDDKTLMCAKAVEHGFSVPFTKEYRKGDRTGDIPFPCIIKPNIVKSRGEFKTKVLQNQIEFEKFCKFLSPKNTYVIQQYIDKECDILIFGCRYQNGKVDIAGSYYKDRWSDDGGGSHGYVIGEVPDYCNLKGIETFLRDIGYTGPFSVEYGLQDNRAYFYEFNLRNDGTSHVFFHCGAWTLVNWVADYANVKSDYPTKVEGKKYVINELLDRINIINGVVSKEQWEKDYKQATAFYFYDENDMEPWNYAKKGMWYKLRISAFLHKYKPIIVHWLRKIR